MIDHNHVNQGDTVGCPACDRREGRPAAVELPPTPRTPEHVTALPPAMHRIRDGRAVCDGDRGSGCHWYPGDDCDHEDWPCGHPYVAHDQCWIIGWIDAVDLIDTATDDAAAMRNDDLEWPDGIIEWEWTGDYIVWSYHPEAPC